MRKIVSDYLSYSKNVKGLSVRTIENYKRCIKILNQFLLYKKISLWDMDLIVFTELVVNIRNMPRPRNSRLNHLGWKISDSSVRNIIIVIRMFLKYCNAIGIGCLHYELIQLPKIKQTKIMPLSKEQLTRTIQAPWLFEEDKRLALRNECIYRLWYSTWIRVQEVLDITVKDIYNSDWTIYIVWKGSQSRNIIVKDDLLDLCKKYYEMRKSSDYPFLFVWHANKKCVKKFTRSWIKMSLHKYRDYIWTNVTFHQLRHTFATDLIEAWVWIEILQKLMWHKSIESTQRYISVNTSSLQNAVNKLHLRGNVK